MKSISSLILNHSQTVNKMKFNLLLMSKYTLPAFYAHKRMLGLFRRCTPTLIYMDYEIDIQILGNDAVNYGSFPNSIQPQKV